MAEDKRLEDGQGDQGPYVPPEQQNGHHDEPGEQDPLMVILKFYLNNFLLIHIRRLVIHQLDLGRMYEPHPAS